MIASVHFNTWKKEWKELDADGWTLLATAAGILAKQPEKPNYMSPIDVDLERVAIVCDRLGLDFEVKCIPGGYTLHGNADLATVQQRLTKVADEELPAVAVQAAKGEATIVQVMIPDFAILEIDEVEVMEDACTDELRSKLGEGWRIMAVCPPNGQRRPDYVLGRTPRARIKNEAGEPSAGFRRNGRW